MILDRFLQLRNVEIVIKNDGVHIVNGNSDTLKGLTVLSPLAKVYLEKSKKWVFANKEGEIVIGDIPPYCEEKIMRDDKMNFKQVPLIEKARMIWEWATRSK
jgi:hypothetical protein